MNADLIETLRMELDAANARAERAEAQNLRLHERLRRSLDTRRQLESDNEVLRAELARELARRTGEGRTSEHGHLHRGLGGARLFHDAMADLSTGGEHPNADGRIHPGVFLRATADPWAVGRVSGG